MASDDRKPDGQFVITPRWDRPSSRPCRWASSTGSARRPGEDGLLGIHTGARYPQPVAGLPADHFGKAGPYYYWISRGVDERPVRADRVRKSVGAENTFATDLTDFDAMVVELEPLIEKVWRYCEGAGNRGRTVTLKVKFTDFEMITRSRSVPVAVSSRGDLKRLSVALLQTRCRYPSRSGFSASRYRPCSTPMTRNRSWRCRCNRTPFQTSLRHVIPRRILGCEERTVE